MMKENDTDRSQWEALLKKVESDLAEHEKKVQPLKVTRNYLRELLGLPITEALDIATASENGNRVGGLPEFHKGDFFNLSLADAGYKVLQRSSKSLTVNEIVDVIKGAGREVGGQDPARTLYSSLVRSRKLVLVAKNTFDLSERRPQNKRIKTKRGKSVQSEGQAQTAPDTSKIDGETQGTTTQSLCDEL